MDIMSILLWVIYTISLYFAVFWFLVFLDGGVKDKRKNIKKWPLVTICIPAYNAVKNGLEKTIKSALQLDYPKDKLEVLVVNHGSTDNTSEILNKYKGLIKRVDIKREKDHMKGVALNAGLNAANGEFFVTFDADSYIDKDALKKLLKHFTSENIAAVLPIMKVGELKTIWQKLQWYEFLVNMFYKRVMSKLDCVPVVPGPFSVFRKRVLKEVGGYDGYDLVDDFEMTLKIQQAHYRIVQTMDCSVYSNLPGTAKKLCNQRNRWYLGTIQNVKKYKHMILNKKYGDFGMIQMPTIALCSILGTSIIINVLYHALKPYIQWLTNLLNIHFDVPTLIKNFTLNFHFLDLNYVNLSIAVVMLFITVFVFYYIHKQTKEKPTKAGWITIPVFVMFYFIFLGFNWMIALFDAIRGKRRKW